MISNLYAAHEKGQKFAGVDVEVMVLFVLVEFEGL